MRKYKTLKKLHQKRQLRFSVIALKVANENPKVELSKTNTKTLIYKENRKLICLVSI